MCQTISGNTYRVKCFISHSTFKPYNIKHFISSTTKGVVYLLEYPFKIHHEGKTIQALRVKINEHTNNIHKGFKDHSLSKHYCLHRNREPSSLKRIGIDCCSPHWRGSFVKDISKFETHWSYQLKTCRPYGLNLEWDLNSFNNNSQFVIFVLGTYFVFLRISFYILLLFLVILLLILLPF